MPTYEYRCTACGHEFERFQRMSDPPVRTCPVCKRRKAERRISRGGGLLFKGPGFYATDYRKGDPPKSKESEGAGPGKESGASGGASKESSSGDGGSGSKGASREGESGSKAGES